MNATYKWVLESITAKKVFTDKNNNVRENVIRDVLISFVGKMGEKEEKQDTLVKFDITTLDNFKSVDDLTKEEVLSWALSKLNYKEKERIEKLIMSKFGDIEDESNLIKIFIND